jgi:hypothetical protein
MESLTVEQLKSCVTPRNDQPIEEFLLRIGLSTVKKEEKPSVLPHNQEVLLANIGRYPCLDRRERQEMLGWHPQTMQNALEALKDRYIRPVQTKKGGPGSGYVTYELTEEAKQYMIRRQIPFTKLSGGLIHHCTVQRWIEAKEQEGYKVRAQAPVGNMLIDALATGPQTIGLEVVASDNIKRDVEKFPKLLKHVDVLEVLCTTYELEKMYLTALKKQLPSEAFQRMVIRTL